MTMLPSVHRSGNAWPKEPFSRRVVMIAQRPFQAAGDISSIVSGMGPISRSLKYAMAEQHTSACPLARSPVALAGSLTNRRTAGFNRLEAVVLRGTRGAHHGDVEFG